MSVIPSLGAHAGDEHLDVHRRQGALQPDNIPDIDRKLGKDYPMNLSSPTHRFA
ncbi:MAG: hypothetical protein ABTD50_22400 [Polyangiaceae bacterium]